MLLFIIRFFIWLPLYILQGQRMLSKYHYNPWCSLQKYNLRYIIPLCVHPRKEQDSWGQMCSKVWAAACWILWSVGSTEAAEAHLGEEGVNQQNDEATDYIFFPNFFNGSNRIEVPLLQLINMLFCLVIKPLSFCPSPLLLWGSSVS